MTDQTVVVIDAPHFYAAIVVRDERVVVSAPILRWTLGKPLADVKAYCRRKGWRVTIDELVQ